MNFLQMCQRVFTEGGLSGQITSTENQSGEALRVVQWVQQAYVEIQNDQGLNYDFLRKNVTFKLTAGKQRYSFTELGLPNGAQFDENSVRVALNDTLSDETYLTKMQYPEFRDYWLFSSRRTVQSRPVNCTVDIELNLCFAPTPDSAYNTNFEYLILLDELVHNDDVPRFPTRFHMAIVWHALRSYGMFEAAPEVVSRADATYRQTIFQLQLDQSPEVTTGGAIC